MSLKGVHIIFVISAVVLMVFFGFWAYGQHMNDRGVTYLLTAVISWLAAIGFVFYGIQFYKKIKI